MSEIEISEIEMNEYGVTKDHDQWSEAMMQHLEEIFETIGGLCESVHLESFKDCQYFMTMPVVLLNSKSVAAKTVRFDGDDTKNQIEEFVKDCGDRMVPYMCYKQTVKRLAVDENFMPIAGGDTITTRHTILRYGMIN